MARPDLDTLACVHPECQLFRRAGADTLVMQIRRQILRRHCSSPTSKVA
jgi:hypothetical protein